MPKDAASGLEPLPDIDLRQALSLTDDTAMLQHSAFSTPDLRHGYCTDDNARALIAAVVAGRFKGYDDLSAPIQRYLAFLAYAFNPRTGRFRNFMGYDRTWLEEVGSEESHARTVWALGVAVRFAPDDRVKGLADRLLHRALPGLEGLLAIRPWAFGVVGLEEYLKASPRDEFASRLRLALAERLFEARMGHATEDWPWWEDTLTWGNALLPHALIVAGRSLSREDMLEAGLNSLRWCLDVQTAKAGHLSIIGNKGWFHKGHEPARFDQQPIEAHGLVRACLAAAAVSDDESWVAHARRCFEWFLGRNDVGVPLYDEQTGGCRDGLGERGANPNQGAESTLAYLQSVLDMHLYHESRLHASHPVR